MMERWPDHRPDRPLIGAHRGASAQWPENSRAAFAGAIAAGTDFIETDVRLTRDLVPVACHDADFARLCGDARQVGALTLAQARALNPDLCTIAEVAAQVLPHAFLLLDVKLTDPDDLRTMAASLADVPAAGRTALGLRNLQAVRLLQPHLPGWPRLGLFAHPADYAALAAQGGRWARLWQADATPARIAQLQALGLNVVNMTGQPTTQSVGVIGPGPLANLLCRNPDAVMLNDPGLALRAVRSPVSTPPIRSPEMTRLSRRTLLQTAAALPFASIALPGFAQGTRPEFTVAVAGLPATLEPARELSNVGTRVTYSIFDTLIRRDFLGSPDGGGSELKPHLANGWERVSPSELIVTLRQGVKFHNGDELTSDDVAYTFRDGRLYGTEPTIPGGKPYFGILQSVEAIDRYTVRFVTKVPDVLLEQRLASWCAWIVNKRAYEEMGFDAYSLAPVATGPYKVVSHDQAQATVLEAFDDYFMGAPTAARVTFQAVPELAARVAGLVSGEFDMITNVPPDQVAVIEGFDDIEIRSVVLANSHVLVFDNRDPLLADRRIRQALSFAIDRQKLVDTLWLGKAEVPRSHNYPEYGQMFVEDRALPFDPEKAKALLAEAGYAGQPITYRTQPAYYTNALEAAQVLVEMWKAVGVNALLEVVETSAQMREEGKSQIFNWSNSTRLPDPLGALWVAWGPGGEIQVKDIWAPESRAAFNEAGKALEAETDPDARRALFVKMLDEWETEAPGTILYQPFEAYAIRKDIGWRPTTFYFMDLRPDNLTFAA